MGKYAKTTRPTYQRSSQIGKPRTRVRGLPISAACPCWLGTHRAQLLELLARDKRRSPQGNILLFLGHFFVQAVVGIVRLAFKVMARLDGAHRAGSRAHHDRMGLT